MRKNVSHLLVKLVRNRGNGSPEYQETRRFQLGRSLAFFEIEIKEQTAQPSDGSKIIRDNRGETGP